MRLDSRHRGIVVTVLLSSRSCLCVPVTKYYCLSVTGNTFMNARLNVDGVVVVSPAELVGFGLSDRGNVNLLIIAHSRRPDWPSCNPYFTLAGWSAVISPLVVPSVTKTTIRNVTGRTIIGEVTATEVIYPPQSHG